MNAWHNLSTGPRYLKNRTSSSGIFKCSSVSSLEALPRTFLHFSSSTWSLVRRRWRMEIVKMLPKKTAAIHCLFEMSGRFGNSFWVFPFRDARIEWPARLDDPKTLWSQVASYNWLTSNLRPHLHCFTNQSNLGFWTEEASEHLRNILEPSEISDELI